MHLLNKAHIVLMAPHKDLSNALKSNNIEVISSEELNELRYNEKYHADMQLCIINNKAFIPRNCRELNKSLSSFPYDIVECDCISAEYPNNVSLNVALIGNKLLCKASALDKKLREYCILQGIDIINVNQGYTKCSTLILNDNAIITADTTIQKEASKQGIDVLKITQGGILLEGADYGFIGGCSGVIDDTVYFFGDITTHPDSSDIIGFIKKHNMKHVNLLREQLIDIGGFVQIQ